ncbi:MAG: hypothetical protein E6Q61_02945 [Nitrosomonas sp.]|jgi:mRNA-degrading endonuclease RelE of RelBE toxin-antitoxin system|nr:MAG: hypothetical protein E6Q61_02945 [Nitrosomonas sp.]
MKWAIHMSKEAVAQMHDIERQLVSNLWAALHELAEDPDRTHFQPTEEDPSRYWIGVDGDVVITFEIIDEKRIIRVLQID